jgi:hypothetical protein
LLVWRSYLTECVQYGLDICTCFCFHWYFETVSRVLGENQLAFPGLDSLARAACGPEKTRMAVSALSEWMSIANQQRRRGRPIHMNVVAFRGLLKQRHCILRQMQSVSSTRYMLHLQKLVRSRGR